MDILLYDQSHKHKHNKLKSDNSAIYDLIVKLDKKTNSKRQVWRCQHENNVK